MATLNLSAEIRTGRGKGPARQARLAGNVPGVIYGAGEEATALTIPRRDLEKALQHRGGGNVIVALKVAGATPPERMSLIREVQRDPLSGHIMHIDFHHISMTEQIDVKIPVHFFGLPNGVKNFGGILEHLSREIEIRCLPGDIPERIQVDVSGLNVHDSIHVRDISVPKAEVLTDGDAVLVTVVPPTVQEEVKPAEGEAPAEPELITKDKGAEGETEEKEKDKGKDKDKK